MSSYIEPPLSTDPQDIQAIAFQYIQDQLPGWAPADGNLDTILIEANSLIAAETRDVASRVPTTIFRFLGGNLFGIPPHEPTYAETTVTFTVVDTLGYTIPGGTFIGIRNLAGEFIAFDTANDLVIPVGETTGIVDVRAVEPGERGSGLGGTDVVVDMIDALAYVASVKTNAITTGGTNGETDAEYLNRLVHRLQLIAPRPILPEDFAAFTRDIPGVERARVIDLYNPNNQTFNNERMVTVVPIDVNGEPMSAPKKAEIDAYLQSLREVSFIVHVANPTYSTINVAANVVKRPGADTAVVDAAVVSTLEEYFNPATWGLDPHITGLALAWSWVASSTIRRMDLVRIIDQVDGVDYIVNNQVWLAIDPIDPRATAAAVDITMPGVAPLPRAGTMDITVT